MDNITAIRIAAEKLAEAQATERDDMAMRHSRETNQLAIKLVQDDARTRIVQSMYDVGHSKVYAVKYLKDACGLGLKEALDYVRPVYVPSAPSVIDARD